MKKTVIAAILCLFVALAFGQLLEKTIYVPDSLGGLLAPQCLAYDSASNTVFAGGGAGDCVVAIDAGSNWRVARIPAGRNIQAICYSPGDSALYCANYASGNVTVIDAWSRSAVATVDAGDAPVALCCNRTDNKIYCANYGSASVTVIAVSYTHLTLPTN